MKQLSSNPTAILAWFSEFREITTNTVNELARQCAVDYRIDAALFDSSQQQCYELAWSTAELLAAEESLKAIDESADELNKRLVLVFAAEAMVSLRDRLETVRLEMGLSLDALNELMNRTEIRTFRQEVMSSEYLHSTAKMMATSPENIARLSSGSLAISDDVAMLQDMFVKFAKNTVAPHAEHIHRHDLIIPEDEILKPLREMGVFGLSIPERFGGTAPDDRDDNLTMAVVTEALSEASLGAAGSLITRPEILSRALLAGGTEQQKEKWLPQIALGDPLCGIAITEPDYGSDVASLSLKGKKVEGGWLLNGAKTWCTFAGKAELLMVVTRTDPDKSKGHKGLSLLLAEKPSYEGHDFIYEQENGGKLTGKAIPTIGYRGMHSFDLAFEDFFIPDANVIGEEEGLGKGFYYTMSGMMGGRLQTAARASGLMRAALNTAITYAEDRKVFNKPLIDYPLTGVKLTKMAARYTASRLLTYTIARVMDGGGGRMEASLIKLFACRSAEIIAREALQIHGGMGYAEETAVSRYFVDARVLSIFEGAEETLALKVIARSLLDEAIKQ
tara:strand:+ start:16723 stop:18405 length:1683 start_codon:yes stop_codon:yes gene_type:complete